MSRQVSYSLAVRGNNIAKGSVMLVLANLNATTIHSFYYHSKSNGSLLRTKIVSTIGIIVSTQSQSRGAKNWLAKISRWYEIIYLSTGAFIQNLNYALRMLHLMHNRWVINYLPLTRSKIAYLYYLVIHMNWICIDRDFSFIRLKTSRSRWYRSNSSYV